MRAAKALNRRTFLKASTGLVAGLGLTQLPRRAGAGPSEGTAAVAGDRWQQLAGSIQGAVLLPDDPDYARVAQPWNLRYASILPAGIARCTSTEDVRVCLLWAQENGIPLVTRSGGHSYAGFSTTTGLMIDVSLMSRVAYDAGTGIARLGGGARNADVYADLRAASRSITHGRCYEVGVAGLTLGGGIGFNQRLHGLTCDQLVETEIVTASGDVLRCNEWENTDLLWACRGGGGGNFGINTLLTFQTFPVDEITVFQITWDADPDTLLPTALDLLPATTERLGCKLSVHARGESLLVELLGQIAGTPAELSGLLAPLYRVAPPSDETVRTVAYWDGQDVLSEVGTPEYVHERSRYVYRPIPEGGSRTILDFLRRWPGTDAGASWKAFLAGGATAALAADATAFVHRTALMVSSIELEWTADDSVGAVARNQAWLAEFHEAMRPFTSDESYQNFIDESQTDFLNAYYGANLERLVRIKRQYDPYNVFRYAQSIPLSLNRP
jgi:FAD/FMN-containing dehydrogenase